jgi:hypothetical protein
MNAIRLRCELIATTMIVLSVLISGCSVSRRTFSLDSISKTPFFGIELQEKAKPSSYRSINSVQLETPRVQVAVNTNPNTMIPKVERAERNSSRVETQAILESKNSNTSSTESDSRALPRTDVSQKIDQSRQPSSIPDFQ